ncbi:MAG: CDP-diacylglycerol--serine O-phosphatidyltransferase, partial [Gammaproteobacteria bacterium]
LFEWSIGGTFDKTWFWYRAAWLAAFVYTAGAALRLARFNTRVETADKYFFTGLPSPSAAAILAGFIWLCVDRGISGSDMWVIASVLSVSTGALMVSNVPYYSFKEVDFKNKVPFFAVLIVVLVFVVISTDPPTVLFTLFLGYVASGPVWLIYKKYRQWRGAAE